MDDGKLRAQLERTMHQKIEAGTFSLPVLPVAAAKCVDLLRDPNVSMKAVVAAVEKDPLLAAQMLRSANAAANGGTVATLEAALVRIGLVRVRTLVLAACAHRVFTSRDARIQAIFNGLWEHSLAVGVLARDLVSLSGGDAGSAFLAGILHDIGKPAVGAFLLELEKLAASRGQRFIPPTTWLEVVTGAHRNVGLAIARSWALPETVVQAIESCSDFDPGDRTSIANHVRFANAVTKTLDLYVGPFDTQEVEAQVMVGRSLLSIDDELLSRVTGDLRDRTRKLMQ